MWLCQIIPHQFNIDYETFDGSKEIIIVTDFSVIYKVISFNYKYSDCASSERSPLLHLSFDFDFIAAPFLRFRFHREQPTTHTSPRASTQSPT
jgi:hypothetical protein